MAKLLPARWVLLLALFLICAPVPGQTLLPPRPNCGSIDCDPGYKCIGYYRPTCVRDRDQDSFQCGDMTCPNGDICRWEEAECFKAPCPKQKPICVTSTTPRPRSYNCGDHDCLPGERCEYGATCMDSGCPPPPPPRCVASHRRRPCGYCPYGGKCKVRPCPEDRTLE